METGAGLLRDALSILRETAQGRRPTRIAPDDEMREMDHLLPFLSVMSGYTGFCTSQHRLYQRPISAPEGELPIPGVTFSTKLLSAWGRYFTRAVIFGLQVTERFSDRPRWDRERQRAEQAEFLAQLRQWREIMIGYRDRAVAAHDTTTRRAMRQLHLQYLTVLITISRCIDTTDMMFDRFEPEFREVLRPCTECLGNPEPVSKIRFTFEGGGVAAPLLLIVCKCRRRDLRMKAVAACRKLLWREGAWDGKSLLCSIGLATLEERLRNERGNIPAAARFT